MKTVPDPSSSSTSIYALKIAHVLFMDIVAYSQLPMEEQTRLIAALQQVVRNTSEFSQAQKRRQLLRLPTGDGMALVFFGDPEAPVRCALEIGRALRDQPDLKLRMGIHTGPVQRVEDINANRNVAGGGINLAQRVVDCGDAGHILVSSSVADVLSNMSAWTPLLHDLGKVEVKHGVTIHVFNLYSADVGNPQVPQRLTRSRSKALQRKASIVLIAATLTIGVAAGTFVYSHRQPKLSETDNILIGDFDNRTGDPIFDGSLKQALVVQLDQSPFLNVLSDRKVNEELSYMGRHPGERLTPDIAREACLRSSSKAMLLGSISNVGAHYIIGINAENCETGDSLASDQEEAENRDDVLKALDAVATRIRRKLGESLPSVQKYQFPIEATTSSLEALQNYAMGVAINGEQGDAPSVPFYKRAIELDPNFPIAYAELAVTYLNLTESTTALEYATKAYNLRDRVSERERLRILARYYSATGEMEKEKETYALWIASYPRDFAPHNDLAVNYQYLGQYQKAVAESAEALRLAPDNVINYENLGALYLSLDRLREARAVFDQAFARKLDSGNLRVFLYELAFLQGNKLEMEQQLTWSIGKAEDEAMLLSVQSGTEAYYGHLGKARDYSRRTADSYLRVESREAAALWLAGYATVEADLGNIVLARRDISNAFSLSSGRDFKIAVALALARAGEVQQARKLAQYLEKEYPQYTLLNLYGLPLVKAAIELADHNSGDAISTLQAVMPYELATGGSITGGLYPAYLRGQAYVQARNGTAAGAEFQKILDHPGIVQNSVMGALAHLQIGRAYAMSGDSAKAKAAYQDFLTLWKDADPDIPILKEAKAEYAKLQ